MRDILFKGLTEENGWVEGYYSKMIFENGVEHHYISKDNGESFIVDKETVGEYAGMTSNGGSLFEGDTMVIRFMEDYMTDYLSIEEGSIIEFVIKFEQCRFILVDIKDELTLVDLFDIIDFCDTECTLKGNINDKK